jgi:crotonobetainyl-CoA:carnitine CoA-transferase CaiB-like acyl-CoA transferase
VNSIPEALADPQVRARGLVKEVGGRTLIASPLKLSDTPPAEPTLPPDFGQHTDEVLQGLGLSAAQIQELRTQRIV